MVIIIAFGIVIVIIIIIVVVSNIPFSNCATLKLLKLSKDSISSLQRDFLNQSALVPGPQKLSE